jgi:cobalt/nickel transport system permease protein
MTTGWLRCFSILMKFTVSVSALLALISTTPFADLLVGLQRLKVPGPLIVQLGFLYRYIFVVIDTAQRLLQARNTRRIRFLGWKTEVGVTSSMIGALLMRSLDSAERISLAMQARGFTGRWNSLTGTRAPGRGDGLFALLAIVFMLGLKLMFRGVPL